MANTVGRLDVVVNADTSKVKPQIERAFRSAGKDAAKQFNDDFCKGITKGIRDCYNKNSKALNKQWKRAGDRDGDQYGKGFTKGFGKHLTKRMRLIVGAVIAFGETISLALYGALGGLTALTSSLYMALSAAGALVPVMTALAGGLTALVVGSKGVGKAFGAITSEFAEAAEEGRKFNMEAESIQKALKRLSPQARETAYAFGRLQEPLDKMRLDVQDKLFKDLGGTLDRLRKEVLPGVSDALQLMGTYLNMTIRGFAESLIVMRFGDILKGLAPVVGVLGTAFVDLNTAFLSFVRASTPAAIILAGRFKEATASLRDMIQTGEETGSLNQFLLDAQEHMSAWWSLIRSTGGALNTLFKAGADEGLGLVKSLTDIMDRWNEWMQTVEGQQALQEFFTNSVGILQGFVPILRGLRDAFSTMVTPDAVARFQELGESIGGILPFIGQFFSLIGQTGVINTLFEAINRIGQAFQPLIPALSEVAGLISDTLGGALDAITPLLGTIGETLAGVFESVGPALAPLAEALVGGIQQIADALGPLIEAFGPLLSSVLPPIIAAFTPIVGVIADVASSLAEALVPVVEALTPILAELAPVVVAAFIAFNPFLRVITLLGPLLAYIAPLAGEFLAKVLGLVEPFASLIAKVATFILGLVAWKKLGGQIIGWFGGALKGLKSFGSAIGAWIGRIVGAFATVFGWILRLYGFLFRIYAFLVGTLFKGIVTVFGAVARVIGTVVSGLFTVIRNLASVVGGLFSRVLGAVSGVASAVWNALTAAGAAVIGFFARIIGIIGRFLGGVWRLIKRIPLEFKLMLAAAVTAVVTGMLAISKKFRTYVEKIFKTIGELPGKMRDAMKGMYNAVANWGRKIKNKIKDSFSGAWNWVKDKVPGLARGGIVMSPRTRLVGEEGPEAVIPLARPLSQVDPSVRDMAAMLRGKGGSTSTVNSSKTVNNYMTFTTPVTDPNAIAAQVMNRAVALAG